MSTTLRACLLSVFVVLASLTLAACGGSSGSSSDAGHDALPDADGRPDVRPDMPPDPPPEPDWAEHLPEVDRGPEPVGEPAPEPVVEEVSEPCDCAVEDGEVIDPGCTGTVNGCDEGVCDPVSGLCVGCLGAGDCPGDFDACHEHTCGPACYGALECRVGVACRNPGPDGECGPCRVADECRLGEACVPSGETTVCGSCDQPGADCSGQLCVQGLCLPCTPGDAELCEASQVYGAGYFCGEDGRCTVSCVDLFDCLVVGRVCNGVTDTCEPCVDADACEEAGYALGTPCVAGVCVEDSCVSSAQCRAKLPERPVCGADGHCRSCQASSECALALGVRPGQAVCLATGVCVAGSCGGVEATACPEGRVCAANACVPCTSDGECKAAAPAGLGLDHAICNEAGGCEPGCQTGAECAGSRGVCVANHCEACQDHASCASAYAAGYVCAAGACEGPGLECCVGSPCVEDLPCPVADRVCTAGHVCVDCDATREAYCTGQGLHCRVETATCVACTETTHCGGGQICDAGSFSCRPCLAGECAADEVCANGQCVAGDCDVPGSACAPASGEAAWVCGADHRCAACGGDPACKGPYGDRAICEGGACATGCVPSTVDAATGRICTAENRWRDCLDDPDCVAAGAGDDAICAPGVEPDSLRCLPGCAPGLACTAVLADEARCVVGQVCGADHRWTGCAAGDDCTPFGDDYVCEPALGRADGLGLCQPGVCLGVADCAAVGQICVDRWCVACSTLPEPGAACVAAYGSEQAGFAWLCHDLACLPGDCHGQAGCLASKTICASDHFCTACDDAQFGATPANHDEACAQAWGVTRVCEQGRCEPGCDAPDLCTPSDLDAGVDCELDQLCGDDHRWRDCLDDDECLLATGQDHAICEPFGREGAARCREGCTASSACATAGQVCDATDHRCRPCASNAECGEYPGAYLCVEGACLDVACNAEKPCADGRVCTADHRCVDCTADDATFCGVSAVCDVAAASCVECTAADDHVCTAAGRRCRVDAQACVACLSDADCTGGARICEAFTCRDCLSGECGDGFVCVAGGCLAGDKACAQAGAACDDDADGASDEVCGADHFCRACQADAECATSLGNANGICEAGACVTGCTPGAHDAANRICGDDHRWRACVDDPECATSYGNPARICKGGACTLGCPDVPCPNPTVCGADHRCTTCNLVADNDVERDATCSARYGEGFVCKGTICDLGCWPGTYCTSQLQGEGECLVGQLCGVDRRWRACVDDPECATAYGTSAKICEAGVCSTGCPAIPCPSAKGCSADHRCVDCGLAGATAAEQDAVCKSAHGADWLCEGNTCEQGCVPGAACFSDPEGLPWICGGDNRCAPCDALQTGVAADTACKGAYKDLYFTCGPDHTCAVQCKPGLQACDGGRICSASYKCIDCQDVTDDAKCARDHGTPSLCIDQACAAIECRDDAACASKNPTKPVCLSGFCVGCTQPDPDVPRGDCAEGQVCLDDGRCVAGECESTAWCQAHAGVGFQCVNYRCVGCNQDADCVPLLKLNDPRYSCLSEVGSCDVANHRCRERSSLEVQVGCFLEVRTSVGTPGEFQCFDLGAPYPITTLPDYACLQCDPSQSRHWWTPGLTGSAGNLVDHCFLDRATKPTEPFVSDPEATHAFPWVQGACVAAARFTEAPTSWAHPERVDDEGQAWTDACNTCNPDEYANRFRWSWTPETGAWLPAGGDPSFLDLRVDCDRPLFSAYDAPDVTTPAPWSGSAWGTCWQGECRGLSWTPWLPLGPAGAVDTVLDAVPKGGSTCDLTGSFGGGFGSGVPHPNPGCYGVACP